MKRTRAPAAVVTAFRPMPKERLFLECLAEATKEYGIASPRALRLPASVTRVVDYEYVKACMARKMLRDDDDTEKGRKRHRERVRATLRQSRLALTACKVIGVDNPYVWFTGSPVHGFEYVIQRVTVPTQSAASCRC